MRALSIALITCFYIVALALARFNTTSFKFFCSALLVTLFSALAVNEITKLK